MFWWRNDETARQLVNVVNTFMQLTQIDSQRQKCLDEYTHNSLAAAPPTGAAEEVFRLG